MTEVKPRNLKNKAILFAALLVAMTLHFGAVVWVQYIDLDTHATSRAFWENQSTLTDDEKLAIILEKEDIDRKNEQLAALFKEIERPPPEKETLNYDNKNMQPEFREGNVANLDSNITINTEEQKGLESDLIGEAELIESLPTDNVITSADAEMFSSFRETAKIDLLFPQDEQVADELVKATEAAQGIVEDNMETVATSQAIRAGKAENSSIVGTAQQNRSGFLEQGEADSSAGNFGSLIGTTEITALKPETLHQLDGVEGENRTQTEASLPAGNKDSLRGFDQSTIGSLASSDDFNLNISYARSKEGRGYLFRLELVPKPGVKFKRIVQNVFFLVDRSHSIRFQRYETTKLSVAKSLGLMHLGDTFNILVFDDEVSALSPENVACDPQNITAGRDFIIRQKYGGIFATTDLYSSLGKIVPEAVVENEVNTAILLSDGDTYLTPEKQRETISKWTRKNDGKVSLHCVASGKGNNLALLDLLSVFNKGSLHYATTDKGLEAALFKLMQGIRNPIGKDITVTSVTKSPDVRITFFPNNKLLPNLYEDTPFVVYGEVNQLKDFHVFFQGLYYDKVLDIKQEVSFAKAQEIEAASLEKKLAQLKAYESYSMYLEQGNPFHLQQAKKLLQPYKIPIAFQ